RFAAVKSADFGITPAAHMLRKVHRDMPAGYRSRAVTLPAPRPEIIGDRGHDLLERDRPDPSSGDRLNRHFDSPFKLQCEGKRRFLYPVRETLRSSLSSPGRPASKAEPDPATIGSVRGIFVRAHTPERQADSRVLPDQRAGSAAVHSPDSSAT